MGKVRKLLKLISSPRKFLDDSVSLRVRIELKELDLISINNTSDADIFIAGYPKSGNTWLRNMIAQIILETSTERMSPTLVNEIIPDVHSVKYYKKFHPQTFFKTHHLPLPHYKKVIHIVRDGRDAMVSYYNMEKNKEQEVSYTMKNMIVDGDGIFPSKWYIHCKNWIKNPYNADILTIKYEDLKKNPLESLRRICNFSDLKISDKQLQMIIDVNEISSLRSRFQKYGVKNSKLFKNNDISAFFRKGIVGGYCEEMSEELIMYFNNESRAELEYFKYM